MRPKIEMLGATLALAIATSGAPNQDHEPVQIPPTRTVEETAGAVATSETTVTNPVTSTPTETSTSTETTFPSLPPDPLKPAARETAENLMPLLNDQEEIGTSQVVIEDVVVHETEAPGVSLLVTTETDCTVEFSVVNNIVDSPESSSINLAIWGHEDDMEQVVYGPVTEETTSLLYSDKIKHGDNVLPDSIIVPPIDKPLKSKEVRQNDKILDIRSAAVEIEQITSEVCPIPEPAG